MATSRPKINWVEMLSQAGCSEEIIDQAKTESFDINFKDKHHHTALHYATINNDEKTVDLLVSEGAYLNLDRPTPLYSASKLGYVGIVKLLIKAHQSIDFTDLREQKYWKQLIDLDGFVPIKATRPRKFFFGKERIYRCF
jgi:ankyrin repeat protein